MGNLRKFFLLFLSCILICGCAYRYGKTQLGDAKNEMISEWYEGITMFFIPQISLLNIDEKQLVYQDFEKLILPVFFCVKETDSYVLAMKEQKIQLELDNTDESVGQESQTQPAEGEQQTQSQGTENENASEIRSTEQSTTEEIATETVGIQESTTVKKIVINREKLKDFDYLRQNFYQVDNTTTVGSNLLDVNEMLSKDMRLKENVTGPQILIYHTHSQETYKGGGSVVDVGDYLTELLTQQYGLQVLHHKGEYDVNDRDHAYSNALPAVQKVLAENPTIEVVIDLHRDGVPETTHLVTEVEGRPTAKIMFFNGLSYTTARGELTYLNNPYRKDNLSFSFQMQLAAAEYYPNLTRKIYLKGYRYNMHVCAKTLLIEVGAQTNTYEEVKNAMLPLADILAKVLKGETE